MKPMLKHQCFLLLLLIVVGGIYTLGVTGPLLFDDGANLELLKSLDNHAVPWYVVLLTNPSSSMGRPVSMFSFLLNYWLFGFNVIAFKAGNIILHLAIGVALYRFLCRLLVTTAYSCSRHRISLVVVGCWLLSPLYVSTVLYVVQRMAMLSTLFVLLALYEYLIVRESLAVGNIRKGRLALFFLYFLLGLLSKENAALIPAFLLVLELFFCELITHQRGRLAWRYLVLILIGLPIIAAAALAGFKGASLLNYSSRSFTLFERLLTEARVVWSYIGSLVMPRSNEFGLFHDDIKISAGWTSPITTFIAVVSWLFVIAAMIYARKKVAWRPIAGGGAFFLAGHLMESTVFPLEIYFEHRNYLPGAGIFLMMALIGENAIKNQTISLGAAKLIVSVYFLVLVAVLSQRALIWSRYDNIVYSSYQSHPNSPRAVLEAASQDAQSGKFEDSLQKLEHARSKNLAPLLGVNIQTIWTYCLFDAPGLENKEQQMFDDVPLDGSPYTSIAMRVFNEQLMQRRCNNVPYAQAIEVLAQRIGRYYESSEYQNVAAVKGGDIDSLQLRVLEGLNLTGQTQAVIDLVTQINHASRGGPNIDLIESVALIDVGRFDEARLTLDKLGTASSLNMQLEAGHIATVEAMYWARLKKRAQLHDEG